MGPLVVIPLFLVVLHVSADEPAENEQRVYNLTSNVHHDPPRPYTPTPTFTPTATATPPPPDTPTPSSAVPHGDLSRSIMLDVLRATGWPTYLHQGALNVSACESDWNPRARGAVGEYGLFQIHPVHLWRFDGRNPLDPYENARVALEIFNESGGWGPWTCKP